MKFSSLLGIAALALTLAVSAGQAQAQRRPAAAAPAAAAPSQAAPGAPGQPTDVKTFGDWTVRCFPVTSASPCDMYEELADRTTHQRVLGVSIAYVPSTDRHAIQLAVPLGISIPAGAVIHAGSYATPTLKYRRCDQQGCYVEALLDNTMIQALSRAPAAGTVRIVADNGKPFDLRISFDGFAAAHDAMAELARQKAKPVPAAQ